MSLRRLIFSALVVLVGALLLLANTVKEVEPPLATIAVTGEKNRGLLGSESAAQSVAPPAIPVDTAEPSLPRRPSGSGAPIADVDDVPPREVLAPVLAGANKLTLFLPNVNLPVALASYRSRAAECAAVPKAQMTKHASAYGLAITRCLFTAGGGGFFRIAAAGEAGTRLLCRSDAVPSADRIWSEFLRADVGPAFFRLLLSGPEIINGVNVFNGTHCSYDVVFFVSVAGSYFVNLKLMHSDFHAVNEINHRTQHTLAKYLLVRHLPTLDLASWAPRSSDLTLAPLPAWISFTAGRVPTDSEVDFQGRPVRGFKELRWSGVAAWQVLNRTLARSVIKCLERLPRRAGGGTKRPLRVMISGDSQSRSVFWALKDYLTRLSMADGAPVPVAASGPPLYSADGRFTLDGKKVVALNATVLGDATIRYRWDSYLDGIVSTAAEADLLIVGFGSHPASWGQWSFRRVASATERLAKVLCGIRAQGLPVVWYGAPAWPRPKTVDNFRATNARLGLFNALALASLRRQCGREVAIVDFFELTHAVPRMSKDSAHYDGSVVAPALARQIVHEAVCAANAPWFATRQRQ